MSRHRLPPSLKILVVVAVASSLTLLCHVVEAQPQEKVANIHPPISRKQVREGPYPSSWSHNQIHTLLKHVDLASQQQSQTNVLSSPSSTSVTPLPAFLDHTRVLSPKPSTSSYTPSRFRGGTWRFIITKSANETLSIGTAVTQIGSLADLRTPSTSQQKPQQQLRSHNNHYKSIWQRLRDDFNFKGYGVSVYKSLMALNRAGIAFRLPLLNHWDWWDSNPALPSTALMFCVYYPFDLSMCVTSSMRMDVLRCWFAKSLWLLQAVMLQFLHHLVSALWTIISVLLYPLQQKWRPVPFQLDQRAAKATAKSREMTASYQSEIQERLGTSFWYRWTPAVGFDSRVSVWHMYMPTLEVYSELLTGSKERLFGQWWKSHFASLGLDSALSKGMFSGTGVLSLSGLRFQRKRRSTARKSERPLEIDTLKIPTVVSTSNTSKDKTTTRSNVDPKTTKATLSTILHEDRDKYQDDELSDSTQMMRGGNTTSVVTNHTNTRATSF